MDGKPLLENVRLMVPISSYMVNDLVLEVRLYDRLFHLADGYPVIREDEWDELPWPDKEVIRKEREENAKKREEEWSVFINYLNETGKILK